MNCRLVGFAIGLIGYATPIVEGSCFGGLMPDRKVAAGHVRMLVPWAWEQKQHTLAFRRREGSSVVRFFAVDQIRAEGRSADESLNKMRAAFVGADRKIDSERKGKWKGFSSLDILWHGAMKNGTTVRGEERLVRVGSVIVAIFWYVPESDWVAAHSEMEDIVNKISLH